MAHGKLGQPQTRRLGDLLVAEGLITEAQLRQALAEQKGKTEKLGSILARLGFITEEQLIGFLSRQYGIPSITLTNIDVDTETLRLVPAPIARKYEILPVKRIGGTLTLAMADPTNVGASDLHWEPYEKHFRIRFRMDGVLHEMLSPPKRLEPAIISRLKIMSSLDISERRVPQDGRIKLRFGHREIDFRVSVLPTIFGEKAVLRILDKESLQLDLTKLGFDPWSFEKFNHSIHQPYGM